MVEFGFKFGTFWLPSLCLFHSGICVRGEGVVQDEATVFSLERLHPQMPSFPAMWKWAWAGLRVGAQKVTEGAGLGELGCGDLPPPPAPLLRAWHLSANSLSLEVLDLWMFSCPKSCPSKRPAGVTVFWNNVGRVMINAWQTSEQEMRNTCLLGVPSNVSNQATRFHLNLLWLLWNL